MNDLISRQNTLCAFEKCYKQCCREDEVGDKWIHYETALNEIECLPSAEPEIIYCKDCKHFIREDMEEYTPYGFYNTYFHAFCDKHWDRGQGEYIDVNLDDFCSFADRREDG